MTMIRCHLLISFHLRWHCEFPRRASPSPFNEWTKVLDNDRYRKSRFNCVSIFSCFPMFSLQRSADARQTVCIKHNRCIRRRPCGWHFSPRIEKCYSFVVGAGGAVTANYLLSAEQKQQRNNKWPRVGDGVGAKFKCTQCTLVLSLPIKRSTVECELEH